MKKHGQNGFTLYELLITVLIVGIVLAWGVPNLGGFARTSRISGTTNDLHGSFLLARSEAARAKQSVTICASAEPMGAALCDGATFDSGWIIFLDGDNATPADAQRSADENVLKVFPPVDDEIDIYTDDATYFSFAATGLGQTIAGAGPAFRTAMICDDRGNIVAPGGDSAARRIVVTPIGRSTVIRSQATIAASGDSCT
ncbi:MAG TPA: GspH/FimT family pseudopilin [Woeseiaceae bacterium]|nr:GspH/FimT family pseudopilin [Woeseiaceae bacterium]